MLKIHYDDLKRAEAVHRQIPEFDPAYIQAKYPEKHIDHKNPCIIVAEYAGNDVGYMIGYDMPGSLYLWVNGTVPSYRKKGVFRRMLNELSKEAKRRQYAKITVKSYERFAPMLSALGTYGFERVGTAEESILLEKKL